MPILSISLAIASLRAVYSTQTTSTNTLKKTTPTQKLARNTVTKFTGLCVPTTMKQLRPGTVLGLQMVMVRRYPGGTCSLEARAGSVWESRQAGRRGSLRGCTCRSRCRFRPQALRLFWVSSASQMETSVANPGSCGSKQKQFFSATDTYLEVAPYSLSFWNQVAQSLPPQPAKHLH